MALFRPEVIPSEVEANMGVVQSGFHMWHLPPVDPRHVHPALVLITAIVVLTERPGA
jgi:hypothetical protein